MEKNIVEHNYIVDRSMRSELKQHEPLLIWFTGLSGSGKSTIANRVEQLLFEQRVHTYSLDGDNIRKGLNNNLSFSSQDRTENIRRIAEVAKLMYDSGLVVLAAFVSPYLKDRANIKNIVGLSAVVEIYINTSVEVCESRDVKGLYKKARAGEIKNMTGISAPYEPPVNPDLEIFTDKQTIEVSVQTVFDFIVQKLNLKV